MIEKFKEIIKGKKNNVESKEPTRYEQLQNEANELKIKIKMVEEDYEKTNNYFYKNKFEMNIDEISNYSKKLSKIMVELAGLRYQLSKLHTEISLELTNKMRNFKYNKMVSE